MSRKSMFEYRGKQATVTWDGKLCIHIGECGRAKGDLFVGGRKPWCDPDLSPNADVQEIVQRCPSGALSVEFADGSVSEVAAATNSIQVSYKGPLFVTGDLAIEGAPTEVPGLKFRAALCRCGQSKNKPYCDNSHESAGFQDYGAVGERGDAANDNGGTLQINFAKDGPVLVNGNLCVKSASGREAWHGKKAALCRCGASNNKPFCDGQHKKIGFKSD